MPPIDAPYRNITTGGFEGSHATHNPAAVASAASCEKCHSGSSGYTTSHMNDFVNMTTNINTSPHSSRATYGKPRFFNSTSAPVMQSCSNVNCHFETATPAWNSTQFASPGNCNGCHGSAPSDGSHPTGGSKHALYYGTTVASCVKCHPDHTADNGGTTPFAHATSAGKRPLLVQFSAAPNSGGSYSGTVSYPEYLPSRNPTHTGNCSGLYCHSPGTKNSGYDTPNQTAAWGGSLPCTGCHKADSTSGDKMATGSHGKHISGVYNAIKCSKCHAATATSGMSIVDLGNHVNGMVNVSFDSATTAVNGTYNGSAAPMSKTPGTAFGACTNVYCHSNVQNNGGTGITYKTPTWGTAATGSCGTCHNDGSSHSGAPVMASGSHTKHLSYMFRTGSNAAKCTICHNLAGVAFTPEAGCSEMSCHQNGGVVGNHVNHAVNVDVVSYFGGSYGGTPAPGDGYGACTSVYCHSDGQATPAYAPAITWGTGTLACTACHGNATGNGGGGTALSGKHASHINNEAVLGLGNSFHCIDCHRETVSNDTTISSSTAHVNKMVDYTGAKAGGPLRYDSSAKVCSNFYCHSNGNNRSLVFRNMTGSKNWTGGATLGCNGCHGNEAGGEFSTSATGAPNYASGGAGTNTANSHKRHVYDSGITTTTGCVNCHIKTVDAAAGGKFKDYTAASYHLDGSPDINFKMIGGDTGVFNADRSCSSTYCHGAAASPKWGETDAAIVPLACSRCHSANTSGPWGTASAHKIHWESAAILPSSYLNYSGNVSSAGSYRFTCSSCHSGKEASHATGPVNGNRVAEVFFSLSSAGMKGRYTDAGSVAGTDNGFTWTAGTTGCNTTYCHSNGQGAIGLAAVAWSTTARTGTCVQCHDTSSATATPTGLSGKHDRHTNPANNPMIGLGNGFACVQCHAKTVSGTTVVANKLQHVNRMIDYSGARAGGSAAYNPGTKQCSSIYCHSDGNRGSIVYRNPAAWSSATTYGCNGCHGTGSPATGVPDYANGGAGTATANSHAKHLTALGITDTAGCAACHSKTVNATVAGRFRNYTAAGSHLDGIPSVNMAAAYGGSYNLGTSTCSSVSCHSNGRGGYQSVQWGTLSNCGLCHPIASLSATHAKHIDTAQLPTFYTMTANRSTAATYNFGCSNCHLLDNPNHMNGNVILDLRPAVAGVGTLRSANSAAITTSGAAGTANSGTTGDSVPGSVVKCLNIYCHSNGYAASPAFATTPNWHGGSFAGDRCANCHGNSPNSTIAGSPAHYNGNWLGQGGTGGHLGGIHYSRISQYPSGLAIAGTGNASSHGNAATATTISCNVCHYETVTAARNDDNVVCVTCHVTGNSVGAQTGNTAAITDKSKHVDGTVNIAFQPVNILSKAQVRNQSLVIHPYSSAWIRNAGYKQDGSYDSAKAALNTATMWNGTTKTCSNIACHNGLNVKWSDTGGTTTCVSCHPAL